MQNAVIRLISKGLGNKKKRAKSHPKPTKSQIKTELHYYPATFFWLTVGFKIVFKDLIYKDFKHNSHANVTVFFREMTEIANKKL